MQQGKTPTNVTTASVVAAVQVQEIIKFLVKKEELLALVGRQWTLFGENMSSFVTIIDPDEYCLAHETPAIIEHELHNLVSLRDLLDKSPDNEFLALDLNDDLLTIEPCSKCKEGGRVGLRSLLGEGEGVCKKCNEKLQVFSRTSISSDDNVLDIPFESIVWSKCELVYVRTSNNRIGALVWSSE